MNTPRAAVCIECGETDRDKFYAHPSSRTGVQSRCKRCDNRNRVARSPTHLNGAAFFKLAVFRLAKGMPDAEVQSLDDDTKTAIRLARRWVRVQGRA